jgi:quercetin dioxygenase-like cupin family protein
VDRWDLEQLGLEPHHPQVLLSEDGAARVIALLLPAGEELQEHEVHEHAWLSVHRGAVEVEAGGETHSVSAGALLHWRPQERHTVRAVEESLLVLMLAPWPGEGHPSLRNQ